MSIRKDLHNHISPVNALTLTTINSNTTTNGIIIDRQGFGALEFLFRANTITDGSYAIVVQHGNDPSLSDAATVPADQLLGTTADAGFVAADDNKTKRIGYLGIKRYVRANIVSTGVTSGGSFVAIALKANPDIGPTPNP